MNIYPAIDLKSGQCVRLLRGDMQQATVFSDSPPDQAAAFEQAGCQWLHVVDLDGAVAGESVNGPAISDILARIHLPVQLGGGIRRLEAIDYWLDKGVARVILGTVAARDPELVIEACQRYPGRIAVGIDARDGKVATEGWTTGSQLDAVELGRRFDDCGVSAIIYTDISRDGAMQGPNLDETLALAEAVSTPVILSGGVSSNHDLQQISARAGDTLDGVIIGRALYEGHVDLNEAIRA